MEPFIKKALVKVLEDEVKEERDQLVAGQEYNFDKTVCLRVKGRVRVGEDHEYTPTAEIPIKATLALFVRYCGATGPAALAALERAMAEAATLDKKAAKAIKEIADLDAAEARVAKTLAELPKATRKGSVTVKATATEVAMEAIIAEYFVDTLNK